MIFKQNFNKVPQNLTSATCVKLFHGNLVKKKKGKSWQEEWNELKMKLNATRSSAKVTITK